MTERLHATAVALRHGKRWRAVLLRGPSGAGKSDLALRLIDRGERLIADDQTEVAREGKAVIARAPASIAGLIEARGIGIVPLRRDQLMTRAAIVLLVDLAPAHRIDRVPVPADETLLGVTLPVIALAPFEASACVKLQLALRQIANA